VDGTLQQRSTTTLRDPHRGHLSRLSRRDNGKSSPLVQTSVSISNSLR
jgi:hypothetical protein